MRLGTIIALKADKRSGQTVRELDAYDKTLAAFKALVAAGVAPLAGHPHAELWTATGRAKSHKFREQHTEPTAAPTDEAEKAESEDEQSTQSQETVSRTFAEPSAPRGRRR